MTMFKRFGAVAVLALIAVTPVAAQQVAAADARSAARTACLGGSAEDCRFAVQAYINALTAQGVTGASMDNALASFASSLADAAVKLPAAVRTVVSTVIRDTIAPAISDDGQAQAILVVANNVATGTQTQVVAQATPASAA